MECGLKSHASSCMQDKCGGLQQELTRVRERAASEAGFAQESVARAKQHAEEMSEDLELAHAELEVLRGFIG